MPAVLDCDSPPSPTRLAPGLLLAQGIGRTGNYFNQELFGAPTDLPWGLQIDRPNSAIPVGIPDTTLFHPTFRLRNAVEHLGRSGPDLGGTKLSLQWGRLFALYLVWYGIGRAFLETIRLDPAELILGVRVNVWGALAAIALGVHHVSPPRFRHQGQSPSAYRPGRQWEPESGVDSEDDYYSVDDISRAGEDNSGSQGSTTS